MILPMLSIWASVAHSVINQSMSGCSPNVVTLAAAERAPARFESLRAPRFASKPHGASAGTTAGSGG